jgi:hypothetical protein
MIVHTDRGVAFTQERGGRGGTVAVPVLAAPEVVARLFSAGAPLFWRIALVNCAVLAQEGSVLWVQEDFWQEEDEVWEHWRDPVIYAAHPQRLYDWSRPRGGNQRAAEFDVQHRATWRPRPAWELPFERARLIWRVLHQMEDDYPGYPPDLVVVGGSPCMLRPASPRLHYPCIVEVCHEWLLD